MPWMRAGALTVVILSVLSGCSPNGDGADYILYGGEVWTGSPDRPLVEAVAIQGNEIVAIGSQSEVMAFAGAQTVRIALGGRFVSPGFIDNHTHFNQAGALLLGANLLDVADAESLRQRIAEAAGRLPAGAWITGGNWGAYEDWAQGSAGGDGSTNGEAMYRFAPDRSVIDDLTPDHPVVVNRWDRSAYLANQQALAVAGVTCEWPGVECEAGRPTGRLSPEAGRRVLGLQPPRSLEQRMAEARMALADLRQFGVTTIHDITPPEMFSVYQALLEGGELTTRVYARPTLDRFPHQAGLGLPRNFGSEFLMLGGFKGFVDGIMGASTAMFYEPFDHNGGFGIWRDMMEPAGNMERLLLDADAAGYWPQVHAIGDFAIDTLLTLFQRVEDMNGARPDRRFRVIHAQHMRGPETAERMARLGAIAEVQPYHAIDDMRWMEERIGAERIRWTYAFRTLEEAGVVLSFGSDWPGTQASWYTANPLMGMYAAVTRQTPEGEPVGGWIPEERVSAESALRAYTVNNAYAEGQENRKGRLAPGFLADLVILDQNPLTVAPESLQSIQVDLTMVDGRIVFQRAP